MTLIAAFKCSDGFVLCSDSQETAGRNHEYRVSRQKMTPEQCGNFEIAAAGSGNNGDLIDAFVKRLHDNLRNSSLHTLPELEKFIRSELADFRKNEASDYSRSDKDMSFIIGARSVDPPACVAWKTSATRLLEITGYALTGFEDERYEYLLKNLYRSNMPLAQGIFLGLHVMAVAEQTSNYVKAPVTVVIVKTHSIRQEKQETIDHLGQRVQLFGVQVDNIMLACPDTGLPVEEFADKLKEFVATIVQFRQEYIQEILGKHFEQGLRIDEAYNLIPLGMTISFQANAQQAIEMQKTQEQLVKVLREQEDGKQSYSRILSNLSTLKMWYEAYTNPPVSLTDDQQKASAVAQGEILQAALMGPFKISPLACDELNRYLQFCNTDLGLGNSENVRVRLLSVKKCIDVITKESDASQQELSISSLSQ